MDDFNMPLVGIAKTDNHAMLFISAELVEHTDIMTLAAKLAHAIDHKLQTDEHLRREQARHNLFKAWQNDDTQEEA